MGFTQTNTRVGNTLTGLPTGNQYGQAVFNIGRKYIFHSPGNSNQLIGTLIKCDEDTGAPLSIVKTGWNIAPSGLPVTPSWNRGHCVHVTYDGKNIVMFFKEYNQTTVYKGIWNENNLRFENFAVFVAFASNLTGSNYNGMARINNDEIKIITDSEYIGIFNLKTGAITRNSTYVGGTWSPSSYPFSNTFATLDGYIVGASGDGNNWYVQTGTSAPYHDNPCDNSGILIGQQNLDGNSFYTFPSQHFNVSYYVPNNGQITAYRNSGVYLAPCNYSPDNFLLYDTPEYPVKIGDPFRIKVYDYERDSCSITVKYGSDIIYEGQVQTAEYDGNIVNKEIFLNEMWLRGLTDYIEYPITITVDDSGASFLDTETYYLMKFGNEYCVYDKSFTTKTTAVPFKVNHVMAFTKYTGTFVRFLISTDGGGTFKFVENGVMTEVPEGSQIVLRVIMSLDVTVSAYSIYWM